MAEAVDESYELQELDREQRREAEEREGDAENSFTKDRPGNRSILVIDGSNPVFTRPEGVDDTSTSDVPNIGRDAGVMRRYIIHDKKQFLKNGLGITVNKGDGPNSTILYDDLRTTTGKSGKINGATYKGKKILILRNGRIEYSTDRSIARYVNEFKDLLKKADIEHRRTPAVIVERHIK